MENKKGFSLIELLIVLVVIIAVVVTPLSFWTRRNLDFWITHFKHHQVHVPFWLAFLTAAVGNVVVIVLNIVAEIARIFIA